MLRSRCFINIFSRKCLEVKLIQKRYNNVLVRRNLYQIQSFRLSSVLYQLATKCRFSINSSVKMATSWSMGPGTLEVPLSLFAKNRSRLADKLKSGQVVVLQGGEDISHYDTDIEYVFRQASNQHNINITAFRHNSAAWFNILSCFAHKQQVMSTN